MPVSNTYLLVTAFLIVAGLSAYAVYLHLQIKKKQQESIAKDKAERELAQQNLDKRNNGIIGDIRFIAQALISEQCEITEGVLRIHHLADALDSDIMLQTESTTLHSHFNQSRDMAIKEAYKNLSKKERFQQDQRRFRLEEANKDNVMKEAKLVVEYSFSNLKKLH